MDERWKSVRGWEEKYEVSDHGRVRKKATGTVLTASTQFPSTSLQVSLCRADGKKKTYRVARLVYEAFVGPAGRHYVKRRDANAKSYAPENLILSTSPLSQTEKTTPSFMLSLQGIIDTIWSEIATKTIEAIRVSTCSQLNKGDIWNHENCR